MTVAPLSYQESSRGGLQRVISQGCLGDWAECPPARRIFRRARDGTRGVTRRAIARPCPDACDSTVPGMSRLAWIPNSVVGSEQGRIRPALIVQNDIGNRYSPVVIIAAIRSARGQKQFPTDVLVQPSEEGGLSNQSFVLINQIRTIDKSRLADCTSIGASSSPPRCSRSMRP